MKTKITMYVIKNINEWMKPGGHRTTKDLMDAKFYRSFNIANAQIKRLHKYYPKLILCIIPITIETQEK